MTAAFLQERGCDNTTKASPACMCAQHTASCAYHLGRRESALS